MKLQKLLLLMLLVMPVVAALAQGVTIHIVSDTHVLAPSCLATFRSYNDSKMDCISPELLHAAVDKVNSEAVSGEITVMLIAGDMSYNGERKSHEYVAGELARLQSGIVPLVIPGNHDIDCPYAYQGDKVSADDFKTIYHDCGYSGAEENYGLSYVRRLGDQLAIICLSSALTDGGVTYYSDGTLTGTTLEWMKSQADKLHAEGRGVIVAVHHQLLDHFAEESTNASNRMLNTNSAVNDGVTNDDVRKAFVEAGIKYVFTGHFHAHDAQKATIDGHDIYDISTGGLSTYPGYVRKVVFSQGCKRIDISSSTLSLPRSDMPLAERGVTDWPDTLLTSSDYGQMRLKKYTDSFAASKMGSMASLFSDVTADVSNIYYSFFIGADDSNESAMTSSNWSLVNMVRGDVYRMFYSMSHNYSQDPSLVIPDLTLPALSLTVPQPSSVASVEAMRRTSELSFDLSGRRAPASRRGISIVRRADGRTNKVVGF